MAVLADLEGTIGDLAEKTGASVVGVGGRWSAGSGIVIGPNKVLTNAHNLRSAEVAVTFADGRTERGTAAGVDVDGDIAILDVDTGEVPPLDLADSIEARIGMPVFALADPGGRGLRVTFGVVSGVNRSFRGPRGRRIAGSIEHTAPLLPGSSGGPTIDGEGRLLGVNTNRLGEGFYLAIPAGDALLNRVKSLSEGRAPSRPRLGVGVAPPHVGRGLRKAVGLEETDGLLIRTIETGSAAEQAGLEEGDFIVEVGTTAMSDVDRLYEVIDGTGPGGELQIRVLRGAEERTVVVRLAE